MIADAYQAIPAARAVICPINTRLTPSEIAYILEHSRAKLILVDYEYAHLIKDTKIPVVLSNDTGRAGDPYENFLSLGRKFSEERGWWGLEPEADEDAGFALCYTWAFLFALHISRCPEPHSARGLLEGSVEFRTPPNPSDGFVAPIQPKGVLTTLRGTIFGSYPVILAQSSSRHLPRRGYQCLRDRASLPACIPQCIPLLVPAGWISTRSISGSFQCSTLLAGRTHGRPHSPFPLKLLSETCHIP